MPCTDLAEWEWGPRVGHSEKAQIHVNDPEAGLLATRAVVWQNRRRHGWFSNLSGVVPP
jgi:hypothetical protein